MCVGAISSFFPINTKKRQVCVFAKSFSTLTWTGTRQKCELGHCGAPVSNARVTDFVFADHAIMESLKVPEIACKEVEYPFLWDSRSPEARPRYRCLEADRMRQYIMFVHVARISKSWKVLYTLAV